MYLTIREKDNGVIWIKEFIEDQLYTANIGAWNFDVYYRQNLIVEDGILKFSGCEIVPLTSGNCEKYFPELREYINTPQPTRNEMMASFIIQRSHFKIPINVMEKYYNRFINFGYIEKEQSYKNSSGELMYKISENQLFFRPKDKPLIKQYIGGTFRYEEEPINV